MNLSPTVTPDTHDGQEFQKFEGHLVGVIDTPEQVLDVSSAAYVHGIAQNDVTILSGPDGITKLEQLEKSKTFFSDAPTDFIKKAKGLLEEGKALIAVKVENVEQAKSLADVLKMHGAYGLTHFGGLIDTEFTHKTD